MAKRLPSAAPHRVFLHTISGLLMLIVLIKLAGFFAWNSSIGGTRIIQVVTRLGTTAAVTGACWLLICPGAADSFR